MAPDVIYVPQSTAALVSNVPFEERHPGLQLDKFLPRSQELGPEQQGQQGQKKALELVTRAAGDKGLLLSLLQRRQKILETYEAKIFCAKTEGPLTIHLARTGALENAGLCLHPLYGFVYLPGSGLKGMARAYAETLWLPAQADKDRAWQTIEDIFGWAPNPLRKEQLKNKHHPAQKRYGEGGDDELSPEWKSAAGSLIFHDAWPLCWPDLIVDIVNNHHPSYYGDENPRAPGDWEDPIPVYFLALRPHQPFSFALVKREPQTPEEHLELGHQWLLGALVHLGAGAKTAAGYGTFAPVEGPSPALTAVARKSSDHALELVTPAFLAGANQTGEDCDLRPATLRGDLRWWWRTLHSGYVDPQTLRAMEAAIWGNTLAGGAVRIKLMAQEKVQPVPFDKLQVKNSARLLTPSKPKTTQGLNYMAYGMNDGGKQRHYLPPGAKWTVRFVARSSRYPLEEREDRAQKISAELILGQAQAALWLLCHFGAIGAKGRKGFGSFSELADEIDLPWCKAQAVEFRKACGLSDADKKQEAETPSIEHMLAPLEMELPWNDPWFALDQVGFSAQAFAQKYKHRLEKKGLGLPRKIGQPSSGNFRPSGCVSNRYASPVIYHFYRRKDAKKIHLRVSAFPSPHLHTLEANRSLLSALLAHLKEDLTLRSRDHADKGQTITPIAAPQRPPHWTSRPSDSPRRPQPKTNERVQAVLLEERTKKNGWKARHQGSNLSGPIQNSDKVPADHKPGDVVTLTVQSVSPKQMDFRWPTEEPTREKEGKNQTKAKVFEKKDGPHGKK
jgi:CRISPR-associated protein Cmr6